MDALLFHPKLVHLPLGLAVAMPLVAGGLALAWWRGWLPRRAWLVAVLLQGALVAGGFVAMRTGEAEEERVERVVAEAAIERHEEAAEAFVWGGAAVLVLAVLAAVVRPERLALGLAVAAAAGTVAALGLGVRAGEAGGALVYRHGAASAYIEGNRATPPRARDGTGAEHEADDD